MYCSFLIAVSVTVLFLIVFLGKNSINYKSERKEGKYGPGVLLQFYNDSSVVIGYLLIGRNSVLNPRLQFINTNRTDTLLFNSINTIIINMVT